MTQITQNGHTVDSLVAPNAWKTFEVWVKDVTNWPAKVNTATGKKNKGFSITVGLRQGLNGDAEGFINNLYLYFGEIKDGKLLGTTTYQEVVRTIFPEDTDLVRSMKTPLEIEEALKGASLKISVKANPDLRIYTNKDGVEKAQVQYSIGHISKGAEGTVTTEVSDDFKAIDASIWE